MASTGTPNGDNLTSIRATRDCLQQALVQLDRAESADAGRHIVLAIKLCKIQLVLSRLSIDRLFIL